VHTEVVAITAEGVAEGLGGPTGMTEKMEIIDFVYCNWGATLASTR
jgi:hypothetical protein